MTNAITVDGTSIIQDSYNNGALVGAGLLVYFNGLKFLDEGVDFTIKTTGGFTLIGAFASATYTSSDKFIIIPNWANSTPDINLGGSIYYHPASGSLSRIEQIIVWAKISQSLAARDITMCEAKGITHPTKNLPEILYEVRTSIEWKYAQNRNDSSLFETSQYLYSLCGKYLPLAIKYTSVGSNPSTLPISTFAIQWDYVIMSASLVPSAATLDALSLSNSAVASIGNAISLSLPSAPNSAYKLVIRYALTESNKTVWYNTVLNSGAIQDDIFLPIIASSTNKYIVSRVNGIGLDNSSPTIFS